MVQVFNTGNRRGELAEVLGMGLGKSLGEGINTYFANKALDEVLNDKSLANAPISAKMGKLQSALSSYGETGQNIFKQRMMIEQQALQEENLRQAQREAGRKEQAALEKEQRLFQQQKELQEQKSRSAKEIQKEKSKTAQELQETKTISAKEIQTQKDIAAKERSEMRPPAGGLSGQPVPKEISQKIPQVLNENKNVSADDLLTAFDQADIPRAYSNPYVENRRRETQQVFEPESEKLEAKRVAELSTQIEKDYQTAKNENIRLDRMQKLSDEGEVSTPLMIKALDTIGLPIGILSNPNTEEYRKLETDFIRDARDVFPGGRITNYEIQSYLKTIPTVLNSKEGRDAIIRNRKLLNDAKEIRYNEYKNIIKENNGRRPQNLGILVEERTADKISTLEDEFKKGIESQVQKFQQPIRMIDPQGNPVNIPPDKIEKALKAGAKFG